MVIRFDRQHSLPTARTGFSFIEVLFAVMILGIGFIMIAAMFPVAIQQTQLTNDETAATRVFANASNLIRGMSKYTEWPATTTAVPTATNQTERGVVISLRDTRIPKPTRMSTLATSLTDTVYKRLRGNQIDSANPRFAWAVAYQRNMVWDATLSTPAARAAGNVTFFVWALACRNRSQYASPDDVLRYTSDADADPAATLEPVAISNVTLDAATNTMTVPMDAATCPLGEGAYVVISDDPTVASAGSANGQVLRVSSLLSSTSGSPGSSTWQLELGKDVSALGVVPTGPVSILAVGRGVANPTAPSANFDGGVQDIALFTFVMTP